jgi:hypothetical protein
MSDELAGRLRDYITEARTAADHAEAALKALEQGEAEQAHKLIASAQRVDHHLESILSALGETRQVRMPWENPPDAAA